MRMRSMLFGTLLLLPFASANAAEVFVAYIYGFKTSSPATGAATFTLRDDLSAIDYVITFQDLSSPVYLAHVHRSTDDQIVLPLPLGMPKIGTWTSPSAEAIAQLRSEQLYVNIHSEFYPTGEISGTLKEQLTPVESKTWGAIKALYR